MKPVSLIYLVLAVAVCTANRISAASVVIDGVEYELLRHVDQPNTAILSRIADESAIPETLVIPSTIESSGIVYKVDNIMPNTFIYCSRHIDIVLPETITAVGEAFAGWTALRTISLPEWITVVGDGAFAGCTNLASVSLSPNIYYIGKKAFEGCTSIATVSLPSSLQELGDNAFEGCSSLSAIDLTSCPLSYVPTECFKDCTSLSALELGDNILSIYALAFANCTSLKSIRFPGSLQYMGWRTLYGCGQLESVLFELSDKNLEFERADVFEVDGKYPYYNVNQMLDGCTNLKAFTTGRNLYLQGGKPTTNYITRYSTPVWELTIDDYTSTPFPDITILDDSNLLGVYNRFIQTDEFRKYMRTLTIGRNVSGWPEDLTDCHMLSSLTLGDAEPPSCPAFTDEQYATISLTVPQNSLEAYRQADGWKNFLTIKESGIDAPAIEPSERTLTGRYDLQGRPVADDYRGLVIERYSDGTAAKKIIGR